MVTQQIIERLTASEFESQFQRYRRLQEYADQFRGKRILDCACGSGYGSYYIAEYLGAKEVVGVDMDALAIEYASQNFSHQNLSYLVSSTDGLRDKFLEHFDSIVSSETIEHVVSPELFLEELVDLTATGGTLFLSTPNKDHVSPYLHYPVFRYHTKEFTMTELTALIASNNKLRLVAFGGELAANNAQIKIRRFICFLASFINTKSASRFAENIFGVLKATTHVLTKVKIVYIDKELVNTSSTYPVSPLMKDGEATVSDFFAVAEVVRNR